MVLMLVNWRRDLMTHARVVAMMWLVSMSSWSSSVAAGSDTNDNNWMLVLYTGDQLWAGTDSSIYLELIGELDQSKLIEVKPRKYQLEADGVDRFSLGDLGGRQVGKLKTLIIGKQYSLWFFNDWQLIKAEVIDPNGNKYTFVCNCWLNKHNNKRSLVVSKFEIYPPADEFTHNGLVTPRNTRVFPLTIGILFLLLVLITFTYFGNEICKKWKENVLFFSSSSRSAANSFTSNRTETRSRSPRTLRETDYGNGLLNGQIPLTAIIEDKPPEYKELFPNVYPISQENVGGEHVTTAAVAATVNVNEAPSNVPSLNQNQTQTQPQVATIPTQSPPSPPRDTSQIVEHDSSQTKT